MYEKITSQNQPRMQPFYWILTFEVFVIGIILSIALLLLPFFLWLTLDSVYWLLLLIIGPFAYWMIKTLQTSLKRRIWENRHLDHFELYEHHITTLQWNNETKGKHEERIEWRKIRRLTYGWYHFEGYHAFKEAKFTEKVGTSSFLPCLHFTYHDGMLTKMLTIPFMNNYQSDPWLTEAKKQQIEFAFTNQIYEPRQMKFMQDWLDPESIRVTEWPEHPSEIPQQFEDFVYDLDEELDEEYDEDEEESLETQEQAIGKKKKGKLGIAPLIVLGFQFLVAIVLTRLAANGELSITWTEDPWYVGGIIFVLSILFFMFTKRLVWKHYFIYCLTSFLVLLFAALITGSPDHTLGSEMEATLIGVSLLMPVPALLPMFIFRKIKKKHTDVGGDTL